jgi:hypothetical protein
MQVHPLLEINAGTNYYFNCPPVSLVHTCGQALASLGLHVSVHYPIFYYHPDSLGMVHIVR